MADDNRLNLQDWHTALRADLDAAAAELDAAKRDRLEMLCACESFVLLRASQGDVLAVAVAELVAESRRQNEAAVLDAQFVMPAYQSRRK